MVFRGSVGFKRCFRFPSGRLNTKLNHDLGTTRPYLEIVSGSRDETGTV